MSIVLTPAWPRIRPYLHVVACDQDGTAEQPRLRIEFLGLPDRLSREVVYQQMPCVACGRPINCLRRREGDGWDRLYYACCCQIAVRMACARSGAARDEYARFHELVPTDAPQQLSLF